MVSQLSQMAQMRNLERLLPERFRPAASGRPAVLLSRLGGRSDVLDLSSIRALALSRIEANTVIYDFQMKDLPTQASDDSSHKCCICLENFKEGEKVRVLPCFHRYHKDCIDEWLGRSDRCPLCKTAIWAHEPHSDAAASESVSSWISRQSSPRSFAGDVEESLPEEAAPGPVDPLASSAAAQWLQNDNVRSEADDGRTVSQPPPSRQSEAPGIPDVLDWPAEWSEPDPWQPVSEEDQDPEHDYILDTWERYQCPEGRIWFYCPRNEDWFYVDEAKRSGWHQFCDPATPNVLWWWNARTNHAFFEP